MKRIWAWLALLLLVAGLIGPSVSAQGPVPTPARGDPNVETELPYDGPALEATGSSNSGPLPPQVQAPVNLVLDDGVSENNIGIGGTLEFIFLNRFTPSPAEFPFTLNEVQVYFDSSGLAQVGDDIILVVYENTSGNPDPAVGATHLASFPDVVQAVDAWNIYDISATPVTLNGPGDVLIGVIALETPGTSYWPAALDQTATQQRSWAGWWTSSPPPSPPTLPPDANWTLIDNAGFPGNWMVRGYGESGGGAVGVFLMPDTVFADGCPGVTQTHTFDIYNLVGGDDTFNLTYDVPSGNGTLTGPATVFVTMSDTVPFDVQLFPNGCQPPGVEVIATITVEDSTGTYSDTSVITKTMTSGGMDEWFSAADTLVGTAYHAVAYHDGAIYHIGGGPTRWAPTDQVYRYDVAGDAWMTVSPMITAAFAMDAVTIDDLIYVPGGCDEAGGAGDWLAGQDFLDSLQIYDPVADSWSTGAPMPAQLAGASAVAYGGLLYVVGGLQTDGVASNSLYIYDPVADSWSMGASMAMTRSIAAAAAVDGHIYIAGGYVGTNGGAYTIDTVEIYDIAMDSWSFGPSLPAPWAPYGDGAYQDRYFIVFNGGDVTSSSYYCGSDALWYDTATGMWENLPALPRCLYGSQGVATENRFYLVSGRTNEGGWHMAVEVEYLEECPICTEIGYVQGSVLDMEVMDVACEPAYVHVEPGNMDIPVNPDGTYWASLYAGSYMVYASAEGYSMDGPYALTITTGMTETMDFGLWRPVIEVEPLSIVAIAPPDVVVTEMLTITNWGHEDLEFDIVEMGTIPMAVEAATPAFLTTWLEGEVEIDPQVLSELDARGRTAFFVQMRLQADLSPAYDIEDWSERGWYVYDSLQAATEAQNPIIAYAEARGLEYRSYMVNNTVLIKGGTLEDVTALAARSDVKLIRPNVMNHVDVNAKQAAAPLNWGWNLDMLDPDGGLFGMQAAQVWQDFGVAGDCPGCGNDGGDHIVVANLDTGAFYQHEALVNQYRGNNGDGTFSHDYNWLAPTVTATNACPGADTAPCDYDGHGSGTLGIMAGQTADLVEQIGIAPDARWIACMGCDTPPSGCSDEALMVCADWIVAPTMLDGSNPDPDMRPHVVNNSWGGTGCRDWYTSYIEAWRAAGVFPAFSAGNTIACGAVGSPGDNPPAFGTAAHAADGENLYAGGPSCYYPTSTCVIADHDIDPHLNAPSFGRTAGNAAGQYYNLSGTSGASPHTAGCVALIWSANPSLIGDIDATFTILEESSDRTRSDAGAEGVCGKPACAGSDYYPNYEYGWGYLDCYAAVASVINQDIPWVGVDPVSGTVAPSDAMVVDVNFSCTITDVGQIFTGTLQILHNDPCEPPVYVDLEFACGECSPVEILYVETMTDGCGVTFTTELSGTPPIDWLWDLGAFGTSTDPAPFVNFAMPGTYAYTLTAENYCGEDIYTGTVTVDCEPCYPPSNLAMMWSPLQPGVDEVVTFSGSADGSEPMAYEWWFDGAYYATGASITRTFAMTGDYEVWFRATNDCGDVIITDTLTIYTETICVPVVINDVATDISGCVVDFTPDLSGDIPITFLWHFGDGMTDTVEMPSHDYGATGTYTVTLEVENCAGAGMDDYTFTVAVSCEPPMWTVYLPLVFKAYGP